MRKTIGVIGDIHGRNIWKHFIKDKTVNEWVFIADYVDSFDISTDCMIKNLIDIIEFKKNNMDSVVLLWGNHDWQYFYMNSRTYCQGHNSVVASQYNQLFTENKDLFQMAYKYDNYLFTHAGVTNEWFNNYKDYFERVGINNDLSNIDDCLNMLAYSRYNECFNDKGSRVKSMFVAGSPLWADEKEMITDSLVGFIHIVGHTNIEHKVDYDINGNVIFPYANNTYFIDCLAGKNNFLKLYV